MIGPVRTAEFIGLFGHAQLLGGSYLRRAGVIPQVFVEPCQCDTCAVEEDPPAGAYDFKALGRHAFAGRHDDRPGYLAGIVHDDRGFVIHIEVVVFPERDVRVERERKSEQILPQIHQMIALVDQNAAAFAGPAAAPVTGVVVKLCAEGTCALEKDASDLADGVLR